ncbi:MAG: hypothetical protein CVV27_03090 [Candidatus Melainabacteria bacterium HGW-Melainabacteria-1]|nr:MAG: hypothetical protein CVV27_03090 [Candidatus Melainabacteria bacterium HGW-Melainabacteria-1]
MQVLRPLQPGTNAFTIRFDEALLAGIRASWEQDVRPFLAKPEHQWMLAGGRYIHQLLDTPQSAYFLVSYDTYPLLWFSANQPEVHKLYQTLFEQLGIAADLRQLVDHRKRLVVYSGFLVVGDRAPEQMWHYDYRPGAHAYTLITPLYELAPEHGQLQYQLPDGETAHYRYRSGEAIVFGEGFLHSTEPYAPTGSPRVLVSLTCGTDKWEHWEILSQNIAEQANYYLLPCGHPAGRCKCRQKHHRLVQIRDFFRF